MAVKSMETAMEVMASMEMAPGALPRPDRVPEHRLLSPEIRRWWWRSCGTSSGKLPIDLEFSVGRLYIGGEAASEGDQGAHTIGWCAPVVTRATLGCGQPLPPSGSLLVFVLHPRKIGVSAFVSSNSENISYVAFLKHKTAENRKLAL
jgi:hypothetical protein